MSLSCYILLLTFSLLSQGILLSASKSIRNLEDDMVLNTFRMGKAFPKDDTAEKSIAAPSLEQYKNDESIFMNDEENKNSRVSSNVTWFFLQWKFINPSESKIDSCNLGGGVLWFFCLLVGLLNMHIVMMCIKTVDEISYRPV